MYGLKKTFPRLPIWYVYTIDWTMFFDSPSRNYVSSSNILEIQDIILNPEFFFSNILCNFISPLFRLYVLYDVYMEDSFELNLSE